MACLGREPVPGHIHTKFDLDPRRIAHMSSNGYRGQNHYLLIGSLSVRLTSYVSLDLVSWYTPANFDCNQRRIAQVRMETHTNYGFPYWIFVQ